MPVTLTPTFRRRSPTMLRADTLADDVNGQLLQPLLSTRSKKTVTIIM